MKLNLAQNNDTNRVRPPRPAKHSNGHRPVDEMAALSRRVDSNITDGDIRGALRALTSDDSFAPPTDEVVKKMQERHQEPPTDLISISPPDDTNVPLVPSEADVLKAINSFPPSSSAGLDGIRPAHLCSLLTKYTAEAGTHLLTALTALTGMAAKQQYTLLERTSTNVKSPKAASPPEAGHLLQQSTLCAGMRCLKL